MAAPTILSRGPDPVRDGGPARGSEDRESDATKGFNLVNERSFTCRRFLRKSMGIDPIEAVGRVERTCSCRPGPSAALTGWMATPGPGRVALRTMRLRTDGQAVPAAGTLEDRQALEVLADAQDVSRAVSPRRFAWPRVGLPDDDDPRHASGVTANLTGERA
jgi:hypothetical protein